MNTEAVKRHRRFQILVLFLSDEVHCRYHQLNNNPLKNPAIAKRKMKMVNSPKNLDTSRLSSELLNCASVFFIIHIQPYQAFQ